MTKSVSAEFKTRRDAEMAVEHIVQEHDIERSAVSIGPASDRNTVGTEPARADVEDGHPKSATEGEPALAGKVRVTVEIEDDMTDKVTSSFQTYGGEASS